MAEFFIRQFSGGYKARTVHNCKTSKFTIAVATDYTTAGERLTKTAAGNRYSSLAYEDGNNKKKLDKLISILSAPVATLYGSQELTIHFAGNGIYTLAKTGITQKMADRRAYTILKYLHSVAHISKLYSGGQSGMDEAGVKAALRLGINVEVNMPENNRVRFEDGIDVDQTMTECLSRFLT